MKTSHCAGRGIVRGWTRTRVWQTSKTTKTTWPEIDPGWPRPHPHPASCSRRGGGLKPGRPVFREWMGVAGRIAISAVVLFFSRLIGAIFSCRAHVERERPLSSFVSYVSACTRQSSANG